MQPFPMRSRGMKLCSASGSKKSFTMPYSVKCSGCGSVIARGVKLNAYQKQVGTYRKNKIWSLKLKCLCGQKIIMDEDPQGSEYKVVYGGDKEAEKQASTLDNMFPKPNHSNDISFELMEDLPEYIRKSFADY